MYNTLYFTSSLSEEDFCAEIDRGLLVLGLPDCQYRVNRVHRQEEYLKFGFLYLSQPAVVQAFLGKNLDGSPRVEYLEKEGQVDKWADEEPVEVPLEPLVTFADIRFSEAELPPLEDKFCPRTICCRHVPESVSNQDILDLAGFYSHSPGYPQMKIQGNSGKSPKQGRCRSGSSDKQRIIFLSYAPRSLDARYALLMMKNVTLGNVALHFSSSYKKPKKDFNKKIQ